MKIEYAMRSASLRTVPWLLALLLIAFSLTAHAQARYRITPVGDRPLGAYAMNENAEVAGSYMTNTSPGLGVVVDETQLNAVATISDPRPAELYQGDEVKRPDGSHLYL